MGTPQMVFLPKEIKDTELGLVRCDYDVWLLDDHPLRSHPTQCIPGLGTMTVEWYLSMRKSWKKTLLRAGCLILACLAAIHILRALPSPAMLLSRPATSFYGSRGWQTTCTFPGIDPRPNFLEQSVAAGCQGYRTDIWMHEDELLMGIPGSTSEAVGSLQVQLSSLLARLGASSPGSQTPLKAERLDPERTFIFMLDAKSHFHELYPHLNSQLAALRQAGYLSHWDGNEIVWRRITIAIHGKGPEFDCSGYPYADVFWLASEGEISRDGVTNSLFPFCAG